jgi:hypothetical protein
MLALDTMKCLARTMAKELGCRAKEHSKADHEGDAGNKRALVDDADERSAEAADA